MPHELLGTFSDLQIFEVLVFVHFHIHDVPVIMLVLLGCIVGQDDLVHVWEYILELMSTCFDSVVVCGAVLLFGIGVSS